MELTTTDIANVLTLIGLAASVGALVHRLRHFFKWRRGNDLQAHIASAKSEQQKDRHAAHHMFGSRRATFIGGCLNFVVLFLMMLSLTHPWLKFALFGYLVIGYFMSKEFALRAQQAGYGRLGLGGRIWYRLFYSSIWPLIRFSYKG